MDAELTNMFMTYLMNENNKGLEPTTTWTPPNTKSEAANISNSIGWSTGVSNSLDNQGDSVSKGAVEGGGGMSSAGAQSAAGWSSLVNSFISNSMHKKYANLLEEQQLTLPRSLNEAESIQRNLSTQGLIGYDTMRQGLFDSLAELTNKASETGEPASVLKTLADSYTKVEDTLNNLQISNADAKMKNQLALMTFLSQVKSPYEQRIQEFDISKRLAAEQERMQGKKDLMEGATSLVTNESAAVGSVLNMFMGM